ncbi:peptidase M50 [Deltaproteobacteria bacterium]|nr:peptidase M50 [Deltaproteobacteria bacterium]
MKKKPDYSRIAPEMEVGRNVLENFDAYNLARMILPVSLGLTVHEFAHAWTADRLGDGTARQAGRLTLNPLAHLDPLGTLFLFVSQLFGWAKPVPINPSRFRRPTRDLALVALAGPAMNFLTALALGLAFKAFVQAGLFQHLSPALTRNLIEVLVLAVLVNISLGVFNLLPLPPLDGFQALSCCLPPAWAALAGRQYHFVFLIIFVLLAAGGVFSRLLGPVTGFIVRLIFN